MHIGMERGGYPLALGQFLLLFDMRWRARGGYPLFYGQKWKKIEAEKPHGER